MPNWVFMSLKLDKSEISVSIYYFLSFYGGYEMH